MAQMKNLEFSPGEHVSWKYGVGKATGRVVCKVTEDTKLGGRTFRATPDDPKYRLIFDKTGKEVVRRGEVLSRIEDAPTTAEEEEGKEQAKADESEEGGSEKPEKEAAKKPKSKPVEAVEKTEKGGGANEGKEPSPQAQ